MSTKIKRKDIKQLAKALAFSARNHLEDIHVAGEIDNKLMKKINIQVCQGIYEALNCLQKDKALFIEYYVGGSHHWDNPKEKGGDTE